MIEDMLAELMTRTSKILRGQRRMETKIDSLEMIMSEATDLLDQINDETNSVADRLDQLISLAEQNTNVADASPEVLDGLRAVRDRLKGLAADEDNPVPAVDDSGNPVDGGVNTSVPQPDDSGDVPADDSGEVPPWDSPQAERKGKGRR